MRYKIPKQLACGSKESNPPFPFPPGESRGGVVPPTPLHVPRQPKPLARPMLRLPPQEGFQGAPLNPPLARSTGLASAESSLPLVGPGTKMITRRRESTRAATSALTFMTFS